MVFAAFGPYLAGSIRIEHVLIYAVILLLIPKILAARFREEILLLGIWLMYALASAAASLLHLAPHLEPRGILGGLDTLLLPLVTLTVTLLLASPAIAEQIFRRIAAIVVFLMILNTVLVIASNWIDLSPYLRPFWSAASSDSTVAERAATMGRFSGVFNQPAESGLMYSLAGLMAIYLYVSRTGMLFATIPLIVLGGLLSVSKIFVLGGLPLIIMLWLLTGTPRRTILQALVVIGAVVVTASSGLFSYWTGFWTGFNYLSRLFDFNSSSQNVLDLYSAGRFGSDTALLHYTDTLLEVSPWLGVGLGGWQVPYDNGWFEALVLAGFVGVIAYTFVLLFVFLLGLGLKQRNLLFFTITLGVLLVGASTGVPALTANRFSTVLWIVIGLLIQIRKGQTLSATQTDAVASFEGSILLQSKSINPDLDR